MHWLHHSSMIGIFPKSLHPTLNRIGTPLVSAPGLFFLLALAIMGPLLLPGHILALDSPIALNRDLAGYFWGISDGPQSVFAATYNSAPIAAVMSVLELVLPVWLVQKLLLIGLFWLAGVGASRLPYLHGTGRLYAGALYAVNPVPYIRFVAGQWGMLGAYALAPFAIASFLRLLEDPRGRRIVTTVLLLTVIGFFQTHGLLLVLLAMLVIYLHRVLTTSGAFRRTVRALLEGGALFVGINLFWMVRYAWAGGGILGNIGRGELSYFAASPALDVLSLRGFWLDAPYQDISDLIPVWWVLFVPILFVAVYGAFKMAQSPTTRWLAWSLASTAVLGVVLAAGPGLSATEGMFRFTWDHVPIYRVFRDSHKFLLLTALAYAYLGGYGIQTIIDRTALNDRWRIKLAWLGTVAALALPIVYGLPILFGAWGQLSADDFPEDWYQVRSTLDDDRGDYSVLVLPWHMYLDLPWLDNRWKRLANPAPSFFSQPTISGDNIEAGPTATNSSNPVSKYVEALLRQGDGVSDFGSLIAPLNARYVVLFKTADYRSFDFLRDQDDLALLFEGDSIALFRNESPTARAYVARDILRVDDLEEYFSLDLPRTEHVYVLDETDAVAEPERASVPASTAGIASVDKANPVSYRVKQDGTGYLVFALPQRTARAGWEYRGRSGLQNLGMMPAFEAGPGDDSVTYARFYRVDLPLYGLAMVSLAMAGVWWRRSHWHP